MKMMLKLLSGGALMTAIFRMKMNRISKTLQKQLQVSFREPQFRGSMMHGCLFLNPEARVIDANSPIDPLAWWKMHDGQFPTIAKLARKYLAIPASSAPSERVFSRAKLIQQCQRQRWNLLRFSLNVWRRVPC